MSRVEVLFLGWSTHVPSQDRCGLDFQCGFSVQVTSVHETMTAGEPCREEQQICRDHLITADFHHISDTQITGTFVPEAVRTQHLIIRKGIKT